MNPIEVGKLIAKLRKEAGYTQASLAKILNVTDKAVSKWERGLGLPDSSLLPQLAKLLDCDIEILISGLSEYKNHKWTGLLILDEDSDISMSSIVYDKPVIYYLLSYFLLVGITSINIKTNHKNNDYIQSLNLEQFGIRINYGDTTSSNTMIIYDKFLLFGANLTRVFQSYMTEKETNITPVVDERELPVIFTHSISSDFEVIRKKAERRKMTRGMIYLPLVTTKNLNDASDFVRIYQNNHKIKIADLYEIAYKRAIIETQNIKQ